MKKNDDDVRSLDVPGNQVTEWIADKSSGIVKVLYTINASGKVESAKWQ